MLRYLGLGPFDPGHRDPDRGRRGRRSQLTACQHAKAECDVRDGAGQAPDVIEAPRQRDDSRRRHQAVRRLHSHDAAVGGRPQDRAGRLRSERQRHHAGGDRGRGAARGSTGSMLAVPGIARLGGISMRELGGRGLAEDDGPCHAQALRGRRVLRRRFVSERTRACRRRHPGDVEDILDTHRDAVERPAEPPGLRLLRALARDRAGARFVEMNPGSKRRLHRPDPRQAALEDLDRRERALADPAGRFRDRRKRHDHRNASSTSATMFIRVRAPGLAPRPHPAGTLPQRNLAARSQA